MPTSSSLGQYISERRRDLGLTQEQLAERVDENVRQSDISRLERDKVTLPRRDRLGLLADALEVSLGDLLVRSGWMTTGDGMDQNLEQDAADQAAATVTPAVLTVDDVRTLVQVIETTRALVAATLDSLVAADAALDRTLHALQVPGERSTVHPPVGLITRWEAMQVFCA